MPFTFPIETKDKSLYLIKFEEFENPPIEIEIKLFDITLELVSDEVNPPSVSTLLTISRIIYNFIEDNDVVLYFYCDRSPINKRDNRDINMSHQQYRSILFDNMCKRFLKINGLTNSFVQKKIVLKDTDGHYHFVHLISRIKNLTQLRAIAEAVENMQDKQN